jgi:hypothetical protein
VDAMMGRKWIVVLLMFANFGMALYFGAVILNGVPHTPDGGMYYREAIMLSAGRLYLDSSGLQPKEAFVFLGQYERNGRIFVMYPHFWPFLLAVFIKLEIPQILNPLLSALNLLLIFLLVRRLFDENTGIIAAVLYCFSPLVVILAGEYLAHMATLFFLLSSFYLILIYVGKPKIWLCFLAGLSLGYAFTLRPLTAVGFFIPIGFYFALVYGKRFCYWSLFWFVFGFGIFFGLFLADNYLMTGEFTRPAHPSTLYRDERALISPLNFGSGMNGADSMLVFLSPTIFYGLIPHIILALAAIPVLILREKKHFLCLGIFLSMILVYSLTYTQSVDYGPRYYFESFFAVFALAAQGVLWVVNRFSGKSKKLVASFFVLLLIYNAIGLFIVLPRYKNHNFITSEAVDALRNIDLENSILIVGRSWNWFVDGVTAVFYDPEYKKSFIIRELENYGHLKILEQHPEKAVYIVDGPDKIVPFNISNENATSIYKGDFKISHSYISIS